MYKKLYDAICFYSLLQGSISMIDVMVNGQPRRLAEGTTVAQLLEQLAINPQQVVVEVNVQIIKRDQRASAALAPGDAVEIVRFVGGGAPLPMARPSVSIRSTQSTLDTFRSLWYEHGA